jgi:nucleotide-binding universal stress UspA family protein
MSYKTILVEVEPEGVADARVRCAADLARRFGAVLIGVGAETAPAAMSLDPFDDTLAAYRAVIEADLVAAEQNFRRLAGRQNTEWRAARDIPGAVLIDAARMADLIVAGGAEKPDDLIWRSASIGRVLVRSGRPVLIVPPKAEALRGDRVLIAWRDSREARRAVADSLPLLKAASEVLVLQICEPEDLVAAQEAVAEVALALTRHGVSASSEAQAKEDCGVPATLLKRARWLGADLVVSGGFARGRLGAWAFGGVTRELMAQDDIFALLSH